MKNDELLDYDCDCCEYEDNMSSEMLDDVQIIPLDCSELCDAKMDIEEFNKGVNDYSYICGAISALSNTGLTPSEAIEYIIGCETIKQNIEAVKLNANASIESAKFSSIKIETESI